jgi:type II secretory pathway component PulF
VTLAAPPDSMSPPAQSKSPLIIIYLLYLFMLAIPFAWLMTIIVFGVPYFREIFKDFKIALPALTEQLLSLSVILQSPLVWIPLVLILLALPLAPAFLQTRFKTTTQQVTAFMMITLVVMALSFSATMVIQVALFLPIVKLVESVSGGTPGT